MKKNVTFEEISKHMVEQKEKVEKYMKNTNEKIAHLNAAKLQVQNLLHKLELEKKDEEIKNEKLSLKNADLTDKVSRTEEKLISIHDDHEKLLSDYDTLKNEKNKVEQDLQKIVAESTGKISSLKKTVDAERVKVRV